MYKWMIMQGHNKDVIFSQLSIKICPQNHTSIGVIFKCLHKTSKSIIPYCKKCAKSAET